MNDPDTYSRMPIRAAPYQHQQAAFDFVTGLFGLQEEVMQTHSIRNSRGCALLMEM